MLNRRSLLLTLPLAACAGNPVTDNEFLLSGDGDVVRGAADGVRTAAFGADRAFGDTAQWRGNPIAACFGTAQLEYLTTRLSTDGRFGSTANFATIVSMQQGRDELRTAAGIPLTADAGRLESDLRFAVRDLSQGNRAAADARLAAYNPNLIDRLTSLPRLQRVRVAAGAASAEFNRGPGGVGGRG